MFFNVKKFSPQHPDQWKWAFYCVFLIAELVGFIGYMDGFQNMKEGRYVWSLSSAIYSVVLVLSYILFSIFFIRWQKDQKIRIAGLMLNGLPVFLFLYMVFLSHIKG